MGQAHTKGPWSAGNRQVEADDGTLICSLSGWKNEGVSKANARLIAAAPDLLKACEAAEEWLSGWASAEPYLTTIRAALSAARATGGTE